MKTTDLTITNGSDQFYPTPPSIAEKMLEGIDWRTVDTILEPSAGKGDLILAAARAKWERCGRYHGKMLDVDAIEIDPYLREICKYNFSKQKAKEYWEPYRKLDDMRYNERTESQNREKYRLEKEAQIIEAVDLHVVHDDFLTYKTYKQYHLILMNPPFDNGDLHLLKALDIQKDGGDIICLLNAETLRNPYSERRRTLAQKLRELNAEIEFIEDAFSTDAERKACVDVAIVKVSIPFEIKESTLFERMKKAAEAEYVQDPEITALIPSDSISQWICLYNAEVSATMELIEEYRRLRPYIYNSFDSKHASPIITLVVEHDSSYGGLDLQKYMRAVRLKYWKAFFTNDDFTGRLTSNLREQFNKDVERMADYEFSAFNIKQILVEMNASIHQGVQDTITDLFEKLTVEHSWYPECSKNKHYYNGWKTNQAHKVGKKCIIPTYGIFSSYSWQKTFDVSEAYKVLSDIEKAFDYLDGGRFKGNRYDLKAFLDAADERRQTRNIECTYFTVDLFKKGTVHIKFRPEAMPLVDRLNIYAAKGRGWLPPSYGRATYSNLDAEEKAVVDSFHGDGSEGSGATAYAEVLKDSSYYLSAPSQSMALLEEAK
jgi:16S rRNA G966 N2-methylase RsmD